MNKMSVAALIASLAMAWPVSVATAPPVVPAPPAQPRPVAQVEDPKAVYHVPLEDSPVRGSPEALVTIVEALDFECPFCRTLAPTLRRVDNSFPGKVRFVFKHNPLSMHPNAVPASMLAEEARAEGGDAMFWAAHDRLLEMPALDRHSLERAGAEVGLQPGGVTAVLDSPRYLDRVRRDQALLAGLGALGTPTLFINGRKVVGAQPFESLQVVIEEELAKAEDLVKSGVAPTEVYARATEHGGTRQVLVAASPSPAPITAAAVARISLRPDDPARGPNSAPVTIVVFSDFQCPFCGRLEPTLREVEKSFPGKVRVVWKHQPLPFHRNALSSAKAAEAARLQGKFWAMHDLLFADQQALSGSAYARYAKELGLDLSRFQRDAASPATAKRVVEDQQLASAVGATGTPTLFINCRKVVGAQPYKSLQEFVEQEIRKAEALHAVEGPGRYDALCAANVSAAPDGARSAMVIPLRRDDPVKGSPRALVTVVEFSDFQCPACSRAGQLIDRVRAEFGEDVRVVWKHLPLPMHPRAMLGAIGAEAARDQGKFWEMHDRLFANPEAISEETLEQYAAELGLDVERYRTALGATRTRRRIDEDVAAARAAGIDGTPTFVVNGQLVVGAGMLRYVVEQQLRTAQLAKP